MSDNHRLIRILFLDIENTPNRGWVWDKYQQDVIKFDQEWNLLCFAWKWADEKKTNVLGLDDFPGIYSKSSTNDVALCHALWRLLDEADLVIAHNGREFDIRKINARFAYHGLTPPSPYKLVDTYLTAKKHFKFNGNSQKDLLKYLGAPEEYQKLETGGFGLWFGCIGRDPKAWVKMKRYNKRDVKGLEWLYLKLRPWMETHPNVAIAAGLDLACPRCGHTEYIMPRGWANLKSYRAKRYVCDKSRGGCGRWSTGARQKIAYQLLN